MGCPAHLREFDSDVPPRGRRELGDSINDELMDRLLRHRHFLLMAENGLVRDVVEPLRQAKRDIAEALANLHREVGPGPEGAIRQQTLQQMRRRIDDILSPVRAQAAGITRSGLEEMARREAEIQSNILRSTLPDAAAGLISLGTPNAERVQRMVETPLGGKVWSERMTENFGQLTRQMRRELATSVALGEGMDRAARRLRGAVDKLGVNRSTQIARTEIQRVANQSAMDLYRRNRQVVKGVSWIATLDDRTCFRCMGLDGESWNVGQVHPEPPAHTSCRCYMTPVTRSFEELGLPRDRVPQGTRASMDGQVPASLDYGDWFRGQSASFQRRVLGDRRFELFDAGEIDISDLATTDRILSLDELPTMSLGS